MVLTHDVWKIVLEIAPKLSRQQTRLHMGNQSHRDPRLQQPMRCCALLVLLVSGKGRAASSFIEADSASRCLIEVLDTDLAPIDQSQHQSVDDSRPEFFHEVQCECRSARSERMEISDLRIQAHPLKRSLAFGAEQGIAEREQSVDPVARRTPAPSSWRECPTIGSHHPCKHTKVSARRVALKTAKRIKVGRLADLAEKRSEAQSGSPQFSLIRFVGTVSRCSEQERSRVLHFASHELASKDECLLGFTERFVLGAAKHHVADRSTAEARSEAAVAC